MTRDELIWTAEQVADGARSEILAEFKRVAALAGITGRAGGSVRDGDRLLCRGWRDLARMVRRQSVYADRLLEAANRPVITYPEHEKLAKIKDVSQAQGDFIEWLRGQGVHLMTYVEQVGWATPHHGLTDLLAQFHKIDQNAIEREKRQMLEEIRAAAS